MLRKKKRIPTQADETYYDPYDIYDVADEGYLGAVVGQVRHKNRSIDWVSCREEFQEHYPRIKRILFWTENKEGVAAFIAQAEKILKLPLRHRAKFYRTTDRHVLYCQLSNWWASKVRRQLFTILLRAGSRYNPKRHTAASFWATARRSHYFNHPGSMRAFRHFMNGCTKYRCGGEDNFFSGWVSSFSYITRDELNERLVKEDANRKRKKIRYTGK